MVLSLLSLGSTSTSAWQPPDDLELLPTLDALPCSFTLADGRPVESLSDWQARRQEMKAILQYYAYGHLPPRPDTLYAEDYRQQPPTDNGVVHEFMTLVMGSQTPVRMRYRVDAAQRVQLAVYDLLGRPVRSLSNRDTLPSTY